MDDTSHNSTLARAYRRISRTALQVATFLMLFTTTFTAPFASPAQATNTIPKILNYQARITDSAGVPVANGNLNIWIKLYDASSGGSCLYAMRGSCGSPTYKTVTVTNGVFSMLIGDMNGGDNEIPDTVFQRTGVYLGVTVASDTEMVPRKRVATAPYAINADQLDGLDATSSGSTTPYVVSTTGNGNLVITGDPQGGTVSSGSVYINPASASANETLLGIADNGTNRWMIDKEGDITHTGSLLATAASSTAQFIFRGAASQSNNLFEVQNAITGRLLAVSSTSTAVGDASSTYSVDFTNARVASNLTPTTDATFSLGDYNRRWKDLWLSGGSANIAYDTSGTSVMRLGFETTHGLRGVIATPDNMPLQLRTTRNSSDSNGLYIDTTGNVGIGNVAPNVPLTVGIPSNFSPTTDAMISIERNGAGQNAFYLANTSTNGEDAGIIIATRQAAEDAAIFMDQSDARKLKFSVGTAGTDAGRTSGTAVTIDQTGKVGIGTTSPSATLNVVGGSLTNPAMVVTSNGNSWSEGLSINPSTADNYNGVYFRTTADSITNSWFAGRLATADAIPNAFAIAREGGTSGFTGDAAMYFIIKTDGTMVANGSLGLGNAAPASLLTVGSGTSTFEVDRAGNIRKINNVVYSWPSSQGGASTVLQNNGSGTLSWASPSGFVNLQQAYNNATSSTELSISGKNALSIADTLSGTGNIFEIQNLTNPATGDYSTRYFTVSSTSTLINTAASAAYQVGIGTAAPGAILHVAGSINSSTNLFQMTDTTASGGYLKVTDGTGVGGQFVPLIYGKGVGTGQVDRAGIYLIAEPGEDGSDDAAYIMDGRLNGAAITTASILRVRNNGTDLVTIDPAGKVGIRSGAPDAMLDIDKSQNSDTSIHVVNGNAGGAAEAQVLVGQAHSGANAYGAFSHFGSGLTTDGLYVADRTALIGNDLGGLLLGTESSTPVIFATAGHTASNERMRIDSTGRVGIGNSAPANLLTVGNATSTFEVNAGGNIVRINAVPYSWPSSQGAASTVLQNNGSGTLSWVSASGLATLQTAYDSSTGTTEIFLGSARGALTLADSFSSYGGNLFEIQNRTNPTGDYSNRFFTVSSTSTLLGLTSAGAAMTPAYKLGIGTPDPQASLHIRKGTSSGLVGSVSQIVLETDNFNSIQFTGCDTCAHYIDFGDTGASARGRFSFNDVLSNGFSFSVAGGGTLAMAIAGTGAASGNVGIRTSAPQSDLMVRDSAATPTDLIFSVSNSNDSSRYLTVSSTNTTMGGLTQSASTSYTITPNARFAANLTPSADATYTLGDPALRWKDLWLSGGSANIAYDTSGTSVMKIGIETATGYRGVIATPDNMPLQIKTTRGVSDSTGIYLNTSGGVGIGTTSPSQKLQVDGSIAIRTDGVGGVLGQGSGYGCIPCGANATLELYSSSTGDTTMMNSGAFNMRFGTNNLERLRINSSGNVGIGTTSPASRLTVADASATSTGNIFEIQNTSGGGGYSSRYFTVSSSSTQIGNELFAAGNVNRGSVPDIADIFQAGTVRKNFAPQSDTLGDGTANPFDLNWYPVAYPDTATWTLTTQVSPRGTVENVGQITSTGTSGDYRTALTSLSTGIPDLRGMTITFSVWLKMASGTGSPALNLGRYADNDQGSAVVCSANATSWTRCSFTRTFNAVSYADNSELRVYTFNWESGKTYYVYGAQVEKASNATAYQRNSGTSRSPRDTNAIWGGALSIGNSMQSPYLYASATGVTISNYQSSPTSNIFEITNRSQNPYYEGYTAKYLTVSSTSTIINAANAISGYKVGIGTSTPSDGLQIVGAPSAGGLTVGATTESIPRAINITNAGGNATFGLANTSGQYLAAAAAGDLSIGPKDANSILFGNAGQSGNNVYMILKNDGTVGIGTTTPNASGAGKLEISGAASGNYGVRSDISGAITTISAAPGFMAWNSDNSANNYTSIRVQEGYIAYKEVNHNVGTGDFVFDTVDNSGTLADRLVVGATGTTITGNLTISGTCTGCGGGSSSLNGAYLASTGTTELFITPSQGALTIADTFSGTGNIFEIQDRTNSAGDYSQRYFTVSSTNTSLTYSNATAGTNGFVSLNATGNYTSNSNIGLLNVAANSTVRGTLFSLSGTSFSDGVMMSATASALTSGTLFKLAGGTDMSSGTVIDVATATFAHAGPGLVQGKVFNMNFANKGGFATGLNINSQFNIFDTASTGATTIDVLLNAATMTNCRVQSGNNCSWYGMWIDGYAPVNITHTTDDNLVFRELTLGSGASYVQNTLAGSIDWAGLTMTMPSITQTTGTVTSTGIKITGGTVTSGTSYAILTSASAGSVGFGTLTPATALEVVGSVTLSGDLLPKTAPTYAGSSTSASALDTSATEVGRWTSMKIGSDGLPFIAYRDQTNGDLKAIHCGNATCSSGNTTTALDTASDLGDNGTSVAIGTDGFPVISYYDAGANLNLKVLKCGNVLCSSGNTTSTVDSTGDVGKFSSIVIAIDGKPIVTYYDATNGNLKVTYCGNAACSSGNSTINIETTNDVGQYSSIAVGTDGIPVVSYVDATNGDLRVASCTDFTCFNSLSTFTAVDTAVTSVTYTSIAIGSDGMPVIAYKDSAAGTLNLKVAHCNDSRCTTSTLTTVASTGDVGSFPSIAVGTDGFPIISFYDLTNGDLDVLHCGNVACSSGNVQTSVESINNVGLYTSIVISPDGLPFIVHQDTTNGDLRAFKCADQRCQYTSGGSMTVSSDLGTNGNYFGNVYADTYWGKQFYVTGFDVAETYHAADLSVEAGDLVRAAAPTGTQSTVEKTAKAYDEVMGVISTKPAINLTDWAKQEGDRPVALSGRVPVKVTGANGPIAVGDPIAASSIPGVGMKSTKPGMIVGTALEAWNGSGVGIITVFVQPKWYAGMAIGNDGGVKSTFNDDFTFAPPAYADALQTTVASHELSFTGSAWDSASGTAVSRTVSIHADLSDKDHYQLAFRNDDGNLLASLNQSGDLSIAGSLSVNGGFDYAETFPSAPDLDAGDIVMVDPDNSTGYGVKKSSGKYENTVIGVVSTKPGFLTGKSSADTQPVALAGRVPVKVNGENGAIKPGDPITSSSTPGTGMKATEAGRVVGIALQGFDGAKASDTGTILLFVNPSWWNGPTPVGDTTASSGLSVTQDSLLDFKNSTLSGVAAIISTSGSWSITSDGVLAAQRVEAKTLQTEDVVVVQSEERSAASEGRIPAGYDAVVIQNPAMKANSKVFVSFLGDPGSSWWIGEKGDGNFTLHVKMPVADEAPFEYWIVDVDDRRPPPPQGDGSSAAPPPADPAPTDSASGTPETTGSGSSTPVTPADGA